MPAPPAGTRDEKMSAGGLQRALAAFTGASMIGSLTQVAKGKMTAVVLGPEGVGVLNQLTAIWSLLSALAGFGFYSGMVRHLARNWSAGDAQAMREHVSSSAIFLGAMALIVTAAGVGASGWISDLAFGDGGARAQVVALILLSVPLFVLSRVYRALLNAAQSVRWLVRARIIADVSSVIILGALIWPFGLVGAIMGYIGLHLIFLIATAWFAHTVAGSAIARPQVAAFRWREVRRNLGFGISDVLVSGLAIVATLSVGRLIIDAEGLAQAGLYAMALKVSTVYLAGLTAAGGGYVFPALTTAASKPERDGHLDTTLTLYFHVIPPVIVVLMAGGDVLMKVLFSAEFVPAAALLLLMLPGDLFRIVAETLRTALVAERRLVAYAVLFAGWAALYVGLAAALLPRAGLAGVATAYLVSHCLAAGAQIVTLRIWLGYRMDPGCARAMAQGVVLVAGASAALWLTSDRWGGYAAASACMGLWLMASLRDRAFRRLLASLGRRILPQRGAGR